MNNFSKGNQSVFVTGGAKGIGAAIVREAAQQGYNVAFSYRGERSESEQLLNSLRKEFSEQKFQSYELDVRSSKAVDDVAFDVLDHFPKIDAVVCNAGINVDQLVSMMADEVWDDIITTNLTGAFYTARAFIDHMVANRYGRIVMLSSLNRFGAKGAAAYSASKAGMVGLAKSLAKEYGDYGITCNLVAPGFIESGMTSGKMAPDIEEFWLKYCPNHRLGHVEEVAFAALFLMSPRATMINGVTIPVTGGLDYRP